MDETYIQVKGKWTYFYQAVDKFGAPIALLSFIAVISRQMLLDLHRVVQHATNADEVGMGKSERK
jgi:hypothetical protein